MYACSSQQELHSSVRGPSQCQSDSTVCMTNITPKGLVQIVLLSVTFKRTTFVHNYIRTLVIYVPARSYVIRHGMILVTIKCFIIGVFLFVGGAGSLASSHPL